MHNYFTNCPTPTCFDTIVSSSGSLKSVSCQVTQAFQMQLFAIQVTIKSFGLTYFVKPNILIVNCITNN